METNYQVNWTVKPRLKDHTLTLENRITGMYEKYFEETINFKEETIKKALIKLGWTPPKENNQI